MKKRIISFILAVVLIVGMIPFSALNAAAEDLCLVVDSDEYGTEEEALAAILEILSSEGSLDLWVAEGTPVFTFYEDTDIFGADSTLILDEDAFFWISEDGWVSDNSYVEFNGTLNGSLTVLDVYTDDTIFLGENGKLTVDESTWLDEDCFAPFEGYEIKKEDNGDGTVTFVNAKGSNTVVATLPYEDSFHCVVMLDGMILEPVDGTTYELPLGAEISIQIEPRDGYVVDGFNPFVIKVTEDIESDLWYAFPNVVECLVKVNDKPYATTEEALAVILGGIGIGESVELVVMSDSAAFTFNDDKDIFGEGSVLTLFPGTCVTITEGNWVSDNAVKFSGTLNGAFTAPEVYPIGEEPIKLGMNGVLTVSNFTELTAANFSAEAGKVKSKETASDMLTFFVESVPDDGKIHVSTMDELTEALKVGGEIVLDNDILYTTYINISDKTEDTFDTNIWHIDLAGKTLTVRNSNSNAVSLGHNLHFILSDSSKEQTGVLHIISERAVTQTPPTMVLTGAALEIRGGTVRMTCNGFAEGNTVYGFKLRALPNASLTVSGGKLEKLTGATDVNMLYDTGRPVTITGGEIEDCTPTSKWVITGGVFGFQPKNGVVAGYMVVANTPVEGKWTVRMPEIVNGTPESDKETNNGYITVDKTSAIANDTVTVTVIPSEGCKVAGVYYTNGETETPVTANEEGVYSFKMPKYDITVKARFVIDDGKTHVSTMAELTSALAVGGEIVLDNNIEYTKQLSILDQSADTFDTNIWHIDLAGKTLTVRNSNSNAVSLGHNLHFILSDSSKEQTGVLNIISESTSAPVMIWMGAALEIRGGTVRMTCDGYTESNVVYGFKLRALPNASLTVSGGKLEKVTGASTVNSLSDSSRPVTITGGEIEDCTPTSKWVITGGVFGVQPKYGVVSGYMVVANTPVEGKWTVRMPEIVNGTPESEKATNNGYITIDKTAALGGETVTVTVTPVNGYALGSLIYNDGSDHAIIEDAGVYSFEMPYRKDVTVIAVFEAVSPAYIGDKAYDSFEEALNDAESGDTVKIFTSIDETGCELIVKPGVVLDLNGCSITADTFVLFGELRNSRSSGKLNVSELIIKNTQLDNESVAAISAMASEETPVKVYYHESVDGEDTVKDSFEGVANVTTENLLKVSSKVLVKEKAGVNSVSMIGCITANDLWYNDFTLEVKFIQGTEVVNTKTQVFGIVSSTVSGIASTDLATAAAQGIDCVDGTYLVGMIINGVPAGDYTVQMRIVSLTDCISGEAVEVCSKTVSVDITV